MITRGKLICNFKTSLGKEAEVAIHLTYRQPASGLNCFSLENNNVTQSAVIFFFFWFSYPKIRICNEIWKIFYELNGAKLLLLFCSNKYVLLGISEKDKFHPKKERIIFLKEIQLDYRYCSLILGFNVSSVITLRDILMSVFISSTIIFMWTKIRICNEIWKIFFSQ